MKNMKKKIASLFKKLFYDSELPFLNEADIIWAKRYNTEEEKLKIEKGHRESPYIVIYKKRKKVYALECVSNKTIKSASLLKLQFHRSRLNNLTKDGYIYVGKLDLLNKDRFISKVGVLDTKDLNRIYKSIYLINKRYKHLKVKYFPKRKIKYYLDIGDIVLYNNNNYYIYDIDESFYYVFIAMKTQKGKYLIKINDISYSFNFANKKKIPIQENMELLNISDEMIISNISKLMDMDNKKKKERKELSPGKLINFNNNFYYIFGREGNILLTYKVYLDSKKNDKMYKIVIKNGSYFTLFEEEDISLSFKPKIIRYATLLEMEKIKQQKKEYKKSLKNMKTKSFAVFKSYQPGIIMINTDNLDKYIILKRKYNTIIYAPLEDLNDLIIYDLESVVEFNFDIIEKMDNYKFQTLLKSFNNIDKDDV